MQACSAALVFIQPTPNQSFELLKELCSFTLSGRGASLPTFSSWCWTLTTIHSQTLRSLFFQSIERWSARSNSPKTHFSHFQIVKSTCTAG
jgi:hypothetical protein